MWEGLFLPLTEEEIKEGSVRESVMSKMPASHTQSVLSLHSTREVTVKNNPVANIVGNLLAGKPEAIVRGSQIVGEAPPAQDGDA